jgi:hypothetical protein
MFLMNDQIHWSSIPEVPMLHRVTVGATRSLIPCILAALAGLAAAGSPAAAEDALVEPLDLEMVKRHANFGFTDEQIRTAFNRPFTIPLDRSGLNRSMLKAPPGPGIHPRVLFNPEDLPDIRARLKSTAAGKAVMDAIRKHLDKQLGEKGELRAVYDALAAGKEADLDAVKVRGTAFVTLYECFRCLIDDDKSGGARAAAAVATLARLAQGGIEAEVGKLKNPAEANDFRVVAQGPTYEGTLGLMYDFACGFMTPEQRDRVRAALVRGSAGMTFIGCETLRSLHTNTSNWIPWSARMLFLVCALEGEPGYDAAAYRRCVDAMTGFIGTFFETGEAYEGWGKNFMFVDHLAILAKRGKDVIAAAHLRNAFRRYFIAAMNPWGGGFTFCDSLGGTNIPVARNADVAMYRYFYPADPDGEFVYRNQIRDDYANLTPGGRVNTSHPFSVMDALCCAIYASDYDGSKTWMQAQQAVTRDRPLSLFSEDTCNLLTRTDWTPDALTLNYLNRAVPGGHKYCDRSHFSLYAHGRTWGVYRALRQVREQYLPENRSVVMIDQDGPSVAPAKCVLYQDAPLATAIATDLREPWDYSNNYVIPNPSRTGFVKFLFPLNHFRLHPSPIPWMDMPMEEMPDWLTSAKPAPLGDRPSPGTGWTKRTPPIAFAYRTAVLVRGAHPYALIVDDLRRDDASHTYTWGMTVADDVVLASVTRTGTAERPGADIVLDEKTPVAGQPARHLLVRVLEAAQLDAKNPAELIVISQPNPPQKFVNIPKLVVKSTAVEPRFKMLLFPYRDGQPLPATTGSADRTGVTLAWKDQVDEVRFTAAADHRTRLAISREKAVILPAGGAGP